MQLARDAAALGEDQDELLAQVAYAERYVSHQQAATAIQDGMNQTRW